MAASKAIVYLFAVLVSLALVYSQDGSSPPPGGPTGRPEESSGRPEGQPGRPDGQPGRPEGPSGHPEGPSGNPEGPSEPHGEDHGDHQDRFFFSFSRVASCNYTAEAGRTCRSCNQALTCLSSNVGIIRTCHGLFRYCNEGRCSLYQGSACTATTTTTTAAPAGK